MAKSKMMKKSRCLTIFAGLLMLLLVVPGEAASVHAAENSSEWGEILPGDRPASADSIPKGLWIAGERKYRYTGKAIRPDVRVYNEKTRLIQGRDYTLSYKNNIKAALQSDKTAPTIVIKGVGNYSGSASEKFTIASFDMKDAVLASSVFPAKTNYQPVILTPGGEALKPETDYTISYQTPDGAQPKAESGTAYTLTVTGKGSCQNTKTFEFFVKNDALSINRATVSISKAIKYGDRLPTPQVSLNGMVLTAGKDYAVKYYNASKKGTASAVIVGTGNYSGKKIVKFTIRADVFEKILNWNIVSDAQEEDQKDDQKEEDPSGTAKKILVAYFSATGNTKGIAQKIAQAAGAELFEITPAVPYTSDDLNYNNNDSRANKEQNDPNARPEISSKVTNMGDYSTVMIGYPIWWGIEPRIIDTFMESYDLSGKTLVNFCTSGSSGIDSSTSNLKAKSPDAKWIDGKRFESNADASEVESWFKSLGIAEEDKEGDKEGETVKSSTFIIETGGKTKTAAFADNSSADAFRALLEKGPLTVDMSDYGNFEKVGSIGTSLPQNDEKITTVPGDVILYQGTSITIYYDTNTWNFTRLGNIADQTTESMKEFLGDGDVTVTFSLPKQETGN